MPKRVRAEKPADEESEQEEIELTDEETDSSDDERFAYDETDTNYRSRGVTAFLKGMSDLDLAQFAEEVNEDRSCAVMRAFPQDPSGFVRVFTQPLIPNPYLAFLSDLETPPPMPASRDFELGDVQVLVTVERLEPPLCQKAFRYAVMVMYIGETRLPILTSALSIYKQLAVERVATRGALVAVMILLNKFSERLDKWTTEHPIYRLPSVPLGVARMIEHTRNEDIRTIDELLAFPCKTEYPEGLRVADFPRSYTFKLRNDIPPEKLLKRLSFFHRVDSLFVKTKDDFKRLFFVFGYTVVQPGQVKTHFRTNLDKLSSGEHMTAIELGKHKNKAFLTHFCGMYRIWVAAMRTCAAQGKFCPAGTFTQ